jgi:hypothetical protein
MPSARVNAQLSKIYDFRAARAVARRVPLLFDEQITLIVRVSSNIATNRGWIRAGSLAQCLKVSPGDPKKEVNHLYFDESYFSLDGGGLQFYLEFWPYKWLSDYRLEIWAQRSPIIISEGQPEA